MKIPILITFVTAFALTASISGAQGSARLAATRTVDVMRSMQDGLRHVSLTALDDPVEPDPAEPSVPVQPTSTAGSCNVTSAGGSTCDTMSQSSCGSSFTTTDACYNNTFPARCVTQNGNNVTCSPANCNNATIGIIIPCTSASNGCAHTANNQCQAWTHARYACRTDTPFCENATLASQCGGRSTSNPECTDANTYTRNCVNTVAGGSSCSSTGACNTFGAQCITSSQSAGMCGNFSVAAGDRCTVVESQPNGGGEDLFAKANLATIVPFVLGLFVLRRSGIA